MDNASKVYFLKNGLSTNQVIYQYMDLDYLIRLIEKKEYCVKRKYCFSDKRESCFSLNKMSFSFQPVGAYMNSHHIPITPKKNLWKDYEETKSLLTSCWTYQQENYLMWKSYTSKLGVCIESTINNFFSSLDANDYEIYVGKISYVGYNGNQTLGDALFSKERLFSAEKEIRFYFNELNDHANNKAMVYIPINPALMIESITLSPLIEKTAAKEIKEQFRTKYSMDAKVSIGDLG